MQVNVHEAAPGTTELEVLIDEQQFGSARREVLDKIARSATVPGFRKGKAPRAMVERSVDPTAVRARTIEQVLPEAYRQALADSGLNPLTEPQVEILSADTDNDLRFKLIVHRHPEITPGPTEGLDLTLYQTSITDADVDAEIKGFVESQAEDEPNPDAPAEAGDLVEIEVQVLVDGEPVQDTTDTLEIRIGEYSRAPSVDDDLAGLKTGDTKDITVNYPEDFVAQSLAGKEAVWRVVVKQVGKRRLPELTDDFIKRTTGSETILEYREVVRKQLEQLAADQDREALRSQALSKLLETSQVVFPHILVEQEMDGRLQRLERQLQRTRNTVAEFAAHQGMSEAQLMDQIHVQAELDVTEYLLIHRVASTEGIEITPEEVDAQIEKEGLARGSRPAIINIEKQNESRRSAVTYDLIRNRVLDRIIEKAHIEKKGARPGNPAGAAAEPTAEEAVPEAAAKKPGKTKAPKPEPASADPAKAEAAPEEITPAS